MAWSFFQTSPQDAVDKLALLLQQRSKALEAHAKLDDQILRLLQDHPQSVLGTTSLKNSLGLMSATSPFYFFFSSANDLAEHGVGDDTEGVEIFQTMLKIYDEQQRDETRDLNLLCQACSHYHLPMQYIRIIVERDSQAVKRKCRNLLPIQEAMGNTYRVNHEVVRYLFETYPDAIQSRDENGHLTFIKGWLNNLKDLALFQDMVAYEPALLNEQGPYGTLLHAICCNETSTTDIVQWVIQQAPNLVRQKTKTNGYLPMHLARNLEVAKVLIDAYPEALAQGNNENSLPLHVIVGLVAILCNPGQAAATVKYVAAKYPMALCHRNDFGETPLDVLDHCKERIYGKEQGGRLVQTLTNLRNDCVAANDDRGSVQLVREVSSLQAAVKDLQEQNSLLSQRVQALEHSMAGVKQGEKK